MKKFTTTATPISIKNIIAGIKSTFRKDSYIEEFGKQFANYIGSKYAFLVNSGTTAFYVILKVLQRVSDKTEVIVPAYTAPVVILPIWKAGLKPVLCDISLDTFNMDISSLKNAISDNTLCVVPTHLFGLPCDIFSINELAEEKGIFVVEDAAQAMGSKIDGKMVGTISELGFFSLGKGKNLSTYTGGVIVTERKDWAPLIKEEIQKLENPGIKSKMLNAFLLNGLAIAVQPIVYGIFHLILSKFKVLDIYYSFDAMRYTEFQAAVGISLLEQFPDFAKKRQQNGNFLYKSCKDIPGIRLPIIIDKAEPVYDFFSILFESSDNIEDIRNELWDSGVDTTRMYLRPVHHCYEIGYEKNQELFPNAAYLAERLLILPTHPFIDKSILNNIVEVLKKWYPRK